MTLRNMDKTIRLTKSYLARFLSQSARCILEYATVQFCTYKPVATYYYTEGTIRGGSCTQGSHPPVFPGTVRGD